MGIERRHKASDYCYRKRRIGDRVVSTYIGRGEAAVNQLQQEKEAAKQRRNQEANRHREVDHVLAQIQWLSLNVEQALVQVLTEAGYHRQSRGPWRKQRKPMILPQPDHSNLDNTETATLRIQMSATGNPNPRTQNPKSITPQEENQIIDVYGRLQQDMLVARMARPNDPRDAAETHESLKTMEAALLSEGDSPTERLLIRRIILCYAALHYFELLYFQGMREPKRPKDHALRSHENEPSQRLIHDRRPNPCPNPKTKIPRPLFGIATKLLTLATMPASIDAPESEPTDI